MEKYFCKYCGQDFDEPETKWEASQGDYDYDRVIAYCPYCGSANINTNIVCTCCGDNYVPPEIPEDFLYGRKLGTANHAELCEDCMAVADLIYRVTEAHYGKKYNLEQMFYNLCEMKGWI